MGKFWQDVRYGIRTLVKTPAFTIIAIIAIALSIGANTTIFSCVNALVLHPFNFGQQDRLVTIWESNPRAGFERGIASPADFLDFRSQNHVFDELAAYSNHTLNLTDGDAPAERIDGAQVTPNFFKTIEVEPTLGRAFLPEEGEAGHEQAALLKYSFWQRRFNADPSIIGKQITLNGQSYTVVGVLPQSFGFPQHTTQVWIPQAFDANQAAERGNHFLRALGLLKQGVTRAQADAEMKSIMARLAAAYPETNADRTALVEPLTESFAREARSYLVVLMGSVIFVLLIACANVANLLLARGAARQKEIAIRTALGASRTRLVRQLLTESLLIALIGGALGLLLSVWGIEFIARGVPPNMTKSIPGWAKLGIDFWVFGFTALVSVLTGFVFGLVPAIQTTKTNLNESLKDGGRTSTSGLGRSRMRSILVVAEMALSLVLLVGAGLMIRSFMELLRVDPGFNTTNILTMEIGLTRSKYQTEEQRNNFYQQLLQRLSALPGAQKVAAVNYLPVSGSSAGSNFSIEGRPTTDTGKTPEADYRVVTTGFFDTLGIPLRRGRIFTDRDTFDAPRVIIINDTLARKYFADEDPIGKRIILDPKEKPWEIVGVAGDIKPEELEDKATPGVYLPYLQNPWWTMNLALRTNSDPKQLATAVQNEIRQLDKDQPVYNIRTMEQVVGERLAPKRVTMFLLGAFAFIALLLASVGLYAVISYSVSQRTHEIGIRMALGAQGADILKMIVRQGLILTIIGIALGLVGAFAMTRAMSQILYGVTATDPLTFIGIALLLSAVALLACIIPARRATRVDPMVALRYE